MIYDYQIVYIIYIILLTVYLFSFLTLRWLRFYQNRTSYKYDNDSSLCVFVLSAV